VNISSPPAAPLSELWRHLLLRMFWECPATGLQLKACASVRTPATHYCWRDPVPSYCCWCVLSCSLFL